ncbi:hypothetical protein [Prosthecobacter sp.]|uniref:hypothetical protein n=1 Tax=Prosthecobacter sp. TaxID=1965333 RepID=UPI0037830A48
MVPQRAQTEAEQEKSLKNSDTVQALNRMTGGDWSEDMKGAPGAVAGYLVPGISRFGKLGRKIGGLGRGSRAGRVLRRAAGVAANIGQTVVQNKIENPDAGYEDHKQAVIADYVAALGMRPLQHAAGWAGQKARDHLPGRTRADGGPPGSAHGKPPPSEGQSFEERAALEGAGMPFTPKDAAQPQQQGGAAGEPGKAEAEQGIPLDTTRDAATPSSLRPSVSPSVRPSTPPLSMEHSQALIHNVMNRKVVERSHPQTQADLAQAQQVVREHVQKLEGQKEPLTDAQKQELAEGRAALARLEPQGGGARPQDQAGAPRLQGDGATPTRRLVTPCRRGPARSPPPLLRFPIILESRSPGSCMTRRTSSTAQKTF